MKIEAKFTLYANDGKAVKPGAMIYGRDNKPRGEFVRVESLSGAPVIVLAVSDDLGSREESFGEGHVHDWSTVPFDQEQYANEKKAIIGFLEGAPYFCVSQAVRTLIMGASRSENIQMLRAAKEAAEEARDNDIPF